MAPTSPVQLQATLAVLHSMEISAIIQLTESTLLEHLPTPNPTIPTQRNPNRFNFEAKQHTSKPLTATASRPGQPETSGKALGANRAAHPPHSPSTWKPSTPPSPHNEQTKRRNAHMSEVATNPTPKEPAPTPPCLAVDPKPQRKTAQDELTPPTEPQTVLATPETTGSESTTEEEEEEEEEEVEEPSSNHSEPEPPTAKPLAEPQSEPTWPFNLSREMQRLFGWCKIHTPDRLARDDPPFLADLDPDMKQELANATSWTLKQTPLGELITRHMLYPKRCVCCNNSYQYKQAKVRGYTAKTYVANYDVSAHDWKPTQNPNDPPNTP
eukprot:TRINITY_DN67768_c9_g2_i4.p1 TRINITY_DN67768_c9_g2~~TRINITY_DN67768_c9_g2_i4.p1  ORF type:complete len:326 (-),score=24.90 TRINITY_DN67768_c9_g2_i4:77-1054(-)